jgi:Domain of unknown function (DUF4136)
MKRKPAIILTIVILSSLSMTAQRVSTAYDHHYDFSKVKTFAVTVSPAWGNPATEAYAEEAVTKELRTKGWSQAPSESSADVLVVIQGTVETKKIEESYYDGGIIGPAGVSTPAGVSNARVIEERLGQGTINVFDSRTHELVFSSAGVADVSHDEKKNEQTIKKGVEKVFKGFPPKAKG